MITIGAASFTASQLFADSPADQRRREWEAARGEMMLEHRRRLLEAERQASADEIQDRQGPVAPGRS